MEYYKEPVLDLVDNDLPWTLQLNELCNQATLYGAIPLFDFLGSTGVFSDLNFMCTQLVKYWLTTRGEIALPTLMEILNKHKVPANEGETWQQVATTKVSSTVMMAKCIDLVDKPWESTILANHLIVLSQSHNIEAVLIMTTGLVDVRPALAWVVSTGINKDSIPPNSTIVHLLETAGAFPPGLYKEGFPGGCHYLDAKTRW